MKGEGGRFTVRRTDDLPSMQHVPEDSVLRLDKESADRATLDTSGADSRTDLVNGGRKISLAQLTMEALPRLENYRISLEASKRPSMGRLHGEESDVKDVEEGGKEPAPEAESYGIKLGWIQGVLIPCLLNIWGVMLFLRLSWVVGQSGIGESLLIIAISAVVCVLTTLSLSAISTNGEVKGGGIYYIISRSLGPEFGASIGIVFAFANAVAASMNTIGFCDSLNDLLASFGVQIIDGGVNDTRLVGVVAVAVMIVICAVGMEWESKAQNFLIAIIVGAIIDFIAGACVGPKSDEARAKGFEGLKVDVFATNWGPQYTNGEDFFSVFAIFFPSVTGIQAGANISGDLKDPATSIPKGTLLSLLISMASYALFVVFAGGAALRGATGSVGDLYNGTYTDCAGRNCTYGLSYSYSVMQLMSLWGPFIYAGCFAATLSTALTNLLSVPRLIQALGIDRIYPGFIFFSKGYGKAGEPYRGYVLTFFFSSAFVLIANLDMIAPLISNFYLASYALINFCTFHAALIRPLGWRPTFKYYNTWLSLVGFILCVAIMFLINWITSLITFIIIFALYLIVVYRNPDVNWGSSTQAQTYKAALATAQRLETISEHVKNYRPQVLALTGRPYLRPALADLASLVTRNHALLMCGDISEKRLSHRTRMSRRRKSAMWMQEHRLRAFFNVVDGLPFEDAARSMMQACGIGKMRPNVVMLGFKNNWQTCNTDNLLSYFNVLHNAFENRMALVILRLQDGLDYLRCSDDVDDGLVAVTASSADLTAVSANNANLMRVDSDFSISGLVDRNDSESPVNTKESSISFIPENAAVISKHYTLNSEPKAVVASPKSILKYKKKAIAEQILGKQADMDFTATIPESMALFRTKHKTGTIDVWWLYDDGGLTILLPFIINTRSSWSSCKLRVFALSSRKQELELETVNMASLLSKFRIEYSSLAMVTGITEQPKDETVSWFNNLLDGFRENGSSDHECVVTEVELAAQKDKTYRQLRLRELLLENSTDAALIFMSLPMPRKGSVSAPLYMAWLEALTRDMPPFILTRGNQNSVLTFYS